LDRRKALFFRLPSGLSSFSIVVILLACKSGRQQTGNHRPKKRSKCLILVALVGYPSGQRGQTVNLLAYAFSGSNPEPTTILTVPNKATGFVGWRGNRPEFIRSLIAVTAAVTATTAAAGTRASGSAGPRIAATGSRRGKDGEFLG
jgi:hypothetical protein